MNNYLKYFQKMFTTVFIFMLSAGICAEESTSYLDDLEKIYNAQTGNVYNQLEAVCQGDEDCLKSIRWNKPNYDLQKRMNACRGDQDCMMRVMQNAEYVNKASYNNDNDPLPQFKSGSFRPCERAPSGVGFGEYGGFHNCIPVHITLRHKYRAVYYDKRRPSVKNKLEYDVQMEYDASIWYRGNYGEFILQVDPAICGTLISHTFHDAKAEYVNTGKNNQKVRFGKKDLNVYSFQFLVQWYYNVRKNTVDFEFHPLVCTFKRGKEEFSSIDPSGNHVTRENGLPASTFSFSRKSLSDLLKRSIELSGSYSWKSSEREESHVSEFENTLDYTILPMEEKPYLKK